MVPTVARAQVNLHKYGIGGLKKSQNITKQFLNNGVAAKGHHIEADRLIREKEGL